MGKWVFRKPEPSDVRGTCVKCGEREQKKKSGGKYSALCRQCSRGPVEKASRRRRDDLRARPYKAVYEKKDHCECCGFIAVHPCQLDIDHIDGNKGNNDPVNLQTLCSNCHRLKTWMNRDWETKNPGHTT